MNFSLSIINAEHILPNVSANAAEAPPCNKPYGWWVRLSTGMVAFKLIITEFGELNAEVLTKRILTPSFKVGYCKFFIVPDTHITN